MDAPSVVPHLKQTRPVHASGNTTAALRVHGHEIVGLQISKTGDATLRDAAAAIRCAGSDGIAKIGVPALHGDETALLVATQIANVVCDGWNIFGTLRTRHVSDGHIYCL